MSDDFKMLEAGYREALVDLRAYAGTASHADLELREAADCLEVRLNDSLKKRQPVEIDADAHPALAAVVKREKVDRRIDRVLRLWTAGQTDSVRGFLEAWAATAPAEVSAFCDQVEDLNAMVGMVTLSAASFPGSPPAAR